MLTPRQRKFVSEYLIDRNGAQAAIRAGYSRKGASVIACRLLANTNVKVSLLQAQAKLDEKASISRDEVINILAGIARTKPDTEKMKWSDVLGATDSLARTLGMYQDTNVGMAAFQINIHVGRNDDES